MPYETQSPCGEIKTPFDPKKFIVKIDEIISENPSMILEIQYALKNNISTLHRKGRPSQVTAFNDALLDTLLELNPKRK